MPEISRFLGVVIRMYFFDHDPPHFHTSYAGAECRISLAPLSLLDGTIPSRVLGLVLEWATLHDDELRDNRQRLQAGQSPRRIAPLERAMTMHPRIRSVAVDQPFIVHLGFVDGSDGSVDLAPWIVGGRGIFAALQDPAYFSRITVDAEAGTIVWPNGADLDPDVLYQAAHAAVGMPAPGANRR